MRIRGLLVVRRGRPLPHNLQPAKLPFWTQRCHLLRQPMARPALVASEWVMPAHTLTSTTWCRDRLSLADWQLPQALAKEPLIRLIWMPMKHTTTRKIMRYYFHRHEAKNWEIRTSQESHKKRQQRRVQQQRLRSLSKRKSLTLPAKSLKRQAKTKMPKAQTQLQQTIIQLWCKMVQTSTSRTLITTTHMWSIDEKQYNFSFK